MLCPRLLVVGWRGGGGKGGRAPPCQEGNVASEIRFERSVEMRGHVEPAAELAAVPRLVRVEAYPLDVEGRPRGGTRAEAGGGARHILHEDSLSEEVRGIVVNCPSSEKGGSWVRRSR